jgi:cardiolipin synthase C
MAIPFSGTRLRLRPGVVFAAALLLAACGTLPVPPDKPVSLALADTQATRLGRATESLVRAHPGEAGMLALADGREALRGTGPAR